MTNLEGETGDMAEPRQRVVTLIASATEIVSALGAGACIVGRSHECDWPPEVLRRPALTAPKFKVEGSSGEIDAKVRAIVSEGLSVYRVDAEALRELAPDLIVTQDHCEVCAVSLSDVEAATCAWAGDRTRIVSLRPDGLGDVFTDILRVARALGTEAEGERLVFAMKQRFDEVRQLVSPEKKLRVAFIEWGEPLMSGGNWMPTLIELAGGENLFGTSDGRSEVLAWADLIAADPDVVIIAPCGFDLAASVQEHSALERHEGWRGIKAVREGRVYCADGNAYFNRPGPRLVETAEIIAEILHPTIAIFGHRGAAFAQMPATG